jgi:hypothetical protein
MSACEGPYDKRPAKMNPRRFARAPRAVQKLR